MNSLTVAIPTYKREKDLAECLESIVSQSTSPTEILIIDDDALPREYVEQWEKRCAMQGITLAYYKKDHKTERRGLSESKNIILRIAKGDIVCIFDDDTILEAGLLTEFMRIWNNAPEKELLGVGGTIRNTRKKNTIEKIFNGLFGLTSDYSWDVNDIGYVVWDEWIEETAKGYYMHGGVSSLRREEALKLGFATFSGGRTEKEDVDFCLRAKQAGYYFITVPHPKIIHNHSQVSREDEFMIGTKDATNRREIFRKYGIQTTRGRIRFCWASFGWVLRYILKFRFLAAAGNIYGFLCPARV